MGVLSFSQLEVTTLERINESFKSPLTNANVDAVRYSVELHRALKYAVREHHQRRQFDAHSQVTQSLVRKISLPPHLQGCSIVPILYRRAAPEPILLDVVKRFHQIVNRLKASHVDGLKEKIPEDWHYAVAVDIPEDPDPFVVSAEVFVYIGIGWRSRFQSYIHQAEKKGIRVTSEDLELQMHQTICWEKLVKGIKVEYHEGFSDALRIASQPQQSPPALPEGFENYDLKIFHFPAKASAISILEYISKESDVFYIPSRTQFDLHAAFATTLVEDPQDPAKNLLRICLAKLWRSYDQYTDWNQVGCKPRLFLHLIPTMPRFSESSFQLQALHTHLIS
eukprot:TRINITY_DN6855_c0_g2_i1.p1 TRINITY_DN6855_c0_g2~~TRINITY_DN6855_c0_g2_i1.p1  ORF type:complete len:337 (+),score=82.84 TRINITY_DN6855_c0_g2_i1:60-1070(+)